MQFYGIVQKSSGEGARIGFPTANIPLEDPKLSGIYAAEVVVDGMTHYAAVYADRRRGLLEAHILDFGDDVYGRRIEIRLKKKIRDDQRFTDERALIAQIAHDIQEIRAYFKGL